VVFDFVDVGYLASNFTESGLRQEIHWGMIQATVANQFQDTPYETPEDSFPYADYITCCQQALKDKRQIQTKTQPRPIPGRVNVADIKAKADIVTEVERYTRLRKSGNHFIGRCPLHEDKHPSLMVYANQQSWHCFQCNQGGDVISFIMAVEHTNFRGAAAILGG